MKINFRVIIGVFVFFLMLTQNTNAEIENQASIKRIVYQDNKIVNLQGSTFTATQIIFGEEELVLATEGGDTAAWMVTNSIPNMVFIKPTLFNSDTNITIVTNKHTYYFHAVSNKTLKAKQSKIYAIQFLYPKEEALKREQIRKMKESLSQEIIDPILHKERYNFNYSFSGSKRLIPPHVFDDGRFTYFEIGKNQLLPAIFSVDSADGKEGTLNIRRSGNYLVVQRLAPQFTLRSGNLATSVFNVNEIKRIEREGEFYELSQKRDNY